MNIRIEEQSKLPKGTGWRKLLDILHVQLGILTLVLFLTLLVSESIYRHLLHVSGPVKIGGIATLFGFGLLACAFRIVVLSRAPYRKLFVSLADRRSYLTLTDDYLEREVPGLWQQRTQWSILTSFKESKSSFQLKFGEHSSWLWKRELKTEAAIAEVRAFLITKTSKGTPAVAVGRAG